MKITAIRIDRLRVPLDPPFLAAWDPDPRTSFPVSIVRVEIARPSICRETSPAMTRLDPIHRSWTGPARGAPARNALASTRLLALVSTRHREIALDRVLARKWAASRQSLILLRT